MSAKQELLNTFQSFTNKIKKLGWEEVGYGGYEDVAIYLASPKLAEQIKEVDHTKMGECEYEHAVKSLLLQNREDYILLTTYNSQPLPGDRELVKIHNYD